jgi:hypothetical protein
VPALDNVTVAPEITNVEADEEDSVTPPNDRPNAAAVLPVIVTRIVERNKSPGVVSDAGMLTPLASLL